MRPSVLREGIAQTNYIAPPGSLYPGQVDSTAVASGSLVGDHYAEVRNVVPFSFDDSIDPTHDLDCFFQMPSGALKIYSAKVWVKPAAFRAYETGSSAGGAGAVTSGGGSSTTSSTTDAGGATPSSSGGDLGHTHDAHGGSGGLAGTTTDAQGLHNHATDVQSDFSVPGHDHANAANSIYGNSASHSHLTGNDGSHSHNVGSHSHSVSVTPGTHSSYSHTHTIGHSHSHSHTVDMSLHTHSVSIGSHTHGVAYGIFESTASTGALDLFVSDDGTTFGASVATSGVGAGLTAIDITTSLSITAGDRQVRVRTTGAGALARVKVLVILDLLIKVDPNQ